MDSTRWILSTDLVVDNMIYCTMWDSEKGYQCYRYRDRKIVGKKPGFDIGGQDDQESQKCRNVLYSASCSRRAVFKDGNVDAHYSGNHYVIQACTICGSEKKDRTRNSVNM